jgi:hypothetical protein
VLQLFGVSEAYTPYTTPVNGPRLSAVRAWYHGDRQPPELRVVLDLAATGVTVDDVRLDGDEAVVTLGGG